MFLCWHDRGNWLAEYVFDDRINEKNQTFLQTKNGPAAKGKQIGKVLKIDYTTSDAERGRYIRLCAEVDLTITKPLLSKFRLNRTVWKIEYESLNMICFNCGKGKYGLKDDNCPLKQVEGQTDAVKGPVDGHGNCSDRPGLEHTYILLY